jgi:hypothetical protein
MMHTVTVISFTVDTSYCGPTKMAVYTAAPPILSQSADPALNSVLPLG